MSINNSIKVKNIHSGDRHVPAGYTGWLDFWMEKKGADSIPKCANIECDNLAKHGGHVKKVNSSDNSWYIVPLCVGCNESKNLEFRVEVSNLESLH